MPIALPKLRAPVCVGVTGHRHLDQTQLGALRARVRSTLKELQSGLPHTPLVLLNALAEGADQLVAEVAIELGIALIVPLPMEPLRYATTFEEAEAAERMATLLESSSASCVLGKAEDSDAACFIKLETYLAQHAHLLVALWDGKAERGEGGTASVVETARTSEVQMHGEGADWARQEEIQRTPSIPVLWLRALREGQQAFAGGQDELVVLPPRDLLADDSASAEKPSKMSLADVLTIYLKGGDDLNAVLEAAPKESAVNDPWSQRFQLADAKAIALQAKTRRLYAIRLAMVVGGFLGLEMSVGPFSGIAWASFASLLLMAVGTFGLAKWNKSLDRRYLEFRTLAEHLRISQFLRSQTSHRSRSGSSTQHLRLVAQAGDWLCHTLGAWEMLDSFEENSPPMPQTQDVLRDWVDDQAAYFRKAIVREKKGEKAYTKCANGLLLLGLLISAILGASALPWLEQALSGLQMSLAIAATAVILIAAAVRTFKDYRAFGHTANRYGLALVRFELAQRGVRLALAQEDSAAALQGLSDLAGHARRENSEWFSLQLDRPPDAEI